MTDDLANQLRQRASKQLAATPVSLLEKAADRIEELEAERDVVAKLLAEAVEALRGWIDFAELEGMAVLPSDLEAAGLKGQDDD